MKLSPLAGKPAPKELLVDLARLEGAYYDRKPDVNNPQQLVSFGTSGHRGSSLTGMFTEAHILAITQAICDYRRGKGVDGPLYLGKDTHALSGPAQRTAIEVLAANDVNVMVQKDDGFTPTPAVSRAILSFNRGRSTGLADGIVITPSHNPPEDGGGGGLACEWMGHGGHSSESGARPWARLPPRAPSDRGEAPGGPGPDRSSMAHAPVM